MGNSEGQFMRGELLNLGRQQFVTKWHERRRLFHRERGRMLLFSLRFSSRGTHTNNVPKLRTQVLRGGLAIIGTKDKLNGD